jgi:hypothetical protein
MRSTYRRTVHIRLLYYGNTVNNRRYKESSELRRGIRTWGGYERYFAGSRDVAVCADMLSRNQDQSRAVSHILMMRGAHQNELSKFKHAQIVGPDTPRHAFEGRPACRPAWVVATASEAISEMAAGSTDRRPVLKRSVLEWVPEGSGPTGPVCGGHSASRTLP